MALKRLQRSFAVMTEPVDLNVLGRPLERASVRPADPVTGERRPSRLDLQPTSRARR